MTDALWECRNCDGLFWSDKNCTCDRPYWKEPASQSRLHAAGFRILGPDEVQAIKDEALEEAATLADLAKASREQLYAENNASINAHKAVQSEELAAAIRSLKGGRNA